MRLRRNLLLVAGIVGVVALVFFGPPLLASAFACSGEERAVYKEFPQYVGEVEPGGNPETDSCAAYYETSDSRGEVVSYFEDRFEEKGWEQRSEEAGQAEGEGGELEPSGLVAYRDGFRYEVLVRGARGGKSPADFSAGTYVAAHVSEGR